MAKQGGGHQLLLLIPFYRDIGMGNIKAFLGGKYDKSIDVW